MCRKLVNHFLFAAPSLHSFSPARGMMLPKTTHKAHLGTKFHLISRIPLGHEGLYAAACAACCMLVQAQWLGTGVEGAGQGSTLHPALPFPANLHSGRWHWLDNANDLMKRTLSSMLQIINCYREEGVLSTFPGLPGMWIPVAVQRRDLRQFLHPQKVLLKSSQEWHNCISRA